MAREHFYASLLSRFFNSARAALHALTSSRIRRLSALPPWSTTRVSWPHGEIPSMPSGVRGPVLFPRVAGSGRLAAAHLLCVERIWFRYTRHDSSLMTWTVVSGTYPGSFVSSDEAGEAVSCPVGVVSCPVDDTSCRSPDTLGIRMDISVRTMKTVFPHGADCISGAATRSDAPAMPHCAPTAGRFGSSGANGS